MRITGLAITCILVAALAAAVPPAKQQERDGQGIFSSLEVGQRISLKDLGTVYEIRLLPGNPAVGGEVVAVSEDHVVVRDPGGVTTTTVPAFAVKCVVRLNLDR